MTSVDVKSGYKQGYHVPKHRAGQGRLESVDCSSHSLCVSHFCNPKTTSNLNNMCDVPTIMIGTHFKAAFADHL